MCNGIEEMIDLIRVTLPAMFRYLFSQRSKRLLNFSRFCKSKSILRVEVINFFNDDGVDGEKNILDLLRFIFCPEILEK